MEQAYASGREKDVSSGYKELDKIRDEIHEVDLQRERVYGIEEQQKRNKRAGIFKRCAAYIATTAAGIVITTAVGWASPGNVIQYWGNVKSLNAVGSDITKIVNTAVPSKSQTIDNKIQGGK